MPSAWSQKKYIKALIFAAEAHRGQKVPGMDLPYIIHVTLVAMEVIAALAHEDTLSGDLAVQCALLHDAIEDAGVSYESLSVEFGHGVAEGVRALSKNHTLKSNQEKMADSLARIKQQPKEVWMVKLSDRITNLQPPPSHWHAEKIASYREEGKWILNELGDACPYLAERLRQKIKAYAI
jgi:(p)ppGpp synthase/HD superfamily hydrolase